MSNSTSHLPSIKSMLRIDSAAGFSWGLLVVCLHAPISSWLGLPQGFILFQAMANFTYAAYSGSLAMRSEHPESRLRFLVTANFLYGMLCFGCLVYFFEVATVYGKIWLALEGCALAALALFERKVFFGRG